MAPDRSEVDAELQRRHRLQEPSLDILLQQTRASRMVSLRMDELLQDEAWNVYRAHLKALQEADEAEAAQWRGHLEQPGQTGDQLGMIQQQLQRVLGRLERGRQALDLPATLRARDEALQQAVGKLLDTASGDLVVPSG